MNRRSVKKTSKQFYKKVKGTVGIEDVTAQLKELGYSVVMFNAPDGDEMLQTLKISPGSAKAFTYCGSVRVVFVDATLHTNDKLYSLLHELGHIMLEHIGSGKSDMYDRRTAENEAEAFAYTVLSYRKPGVLIPLLILIITLLCLWCSSAFSQKASPVSGSPAGYVCVTQSGKKYHRESCGHLRGRTYTYMLLPKAARLFQPCKSCNP